MLEIRVIPCLLLQEGNLVKTVKFKNPSYIGDPINAVKIYNEKEVDELIILDIRASDRKSIYIPLLSKIAEECFMPLTYGGGVRNLEDMKTLFGLGIEKISINSYAIENPEFIKKAAACFGSQSIVVSIDVKKNPRGNNEVYSKAIKVGTGMSPEDFALKMQQAGAGEILLNAVDRDGTWDGYDLEMIADVSKCLEIPLIACGGAGKTEHFKQAIAAGASAVAVGSMVVYQKKGAGVLINFPRRQEIKKVF